MFAGYPGGPERTLVRFGTGSVGNRVSMSERRERDQPQEPPENRPDEPGAEGGADSPAADTLPGAPADDDSPLGDTDQHSDA
jgi:hypothetical protein